MSEVVALDPTEQPAQAGALTANPATPNASAPAVFKQLLAGDLFPWLAQTVTSRANFLFDTLAGRYQLFCFFINPADPVSQTVLQAVHRRRHLFDDLHCSFIGVSIAAQAQSPGLQDILPGIRFAWDVDYQVSKACGAVAVDAEPGAPTVARRFWILVDPSLHVLRFFPFSAENVEEVLDAVAQLAEPDLFGGVRRPAPILLLPNVFELDLCNKLISSYDADGGEETGVQRAGKGVLDRSFKSRKDHYITDPGLLAAVNERIRRRVLPEIQKLFFMEISGIERHIVGCYSALDGGHFAPHRDNRETLTAHRRFAISINLNAGFGGGDVMFPEYNTQGYKAPPGWAVVFPCAILHQVRAVTSGARYAFLPFVYDKEGAAIRERGLAKLAMDAPTSP